MKFIIQKPTFISKEYNILDFGAKTDLTYNIQRPIQKAIDMCSENGGGKVIIPNGYFLTGPIELKSNVNLYVSENAFVKFTKSKEEYPLQWTEFEGERRIRAKSPISAKNCVNIAITGNGILDGSGDLWREVKQSKLTQAQWNHLLEISPYVVQVKSGGKWCPSKTYYEGLKHGEPDYNDPSALEQAAQYWDYFRPVFVSFISCDKVLIDGVTLQNSPAWNIHPLYCNNFTLTNAHIKNPFYAQNGDGIDLESCTNCEIAFSFFEVGDDGICIKSGKNRKAREIQAPTENVWIHHCKVFNAHGGFVVGSEMSRGVRNVLIEDCSFSGSDVGLRFKSALGRGGIVENIHVKNIMMSDIKAEAILLTMAYVFQNPANPNETKNVTFLEDDIPEFRNITIENIYCDAARDSIKIIGLKEKPIHDISISNTQIISKNKVEMQYYNNILFHNVYVRTPNEEAFWDDENLSGE
ncbi:MAG: glycoside hydrolase family 28 protein [Anaeroplasmataceae bacterium]|nr:glycoside hydrolase family 28 protein [Anaeroplasmataceae bacterium]